jgi:putative heme-binding domain-containing protein
MTKSPAAVIALSRIDLKSAADLAAELSSSETIDAFVSAFLGRQGGAETLAAAYAGKPPSADAAKLGLRAMSSAGRKDEGLWRVLNKAAGISSAAVEYSLDLVKELAAESQKDGDPAAGEKVFRGTLTNCFSCHAIGAAGGKVGPDLSAVGTGLPIDMVIESILWPNRQVKEGYTSIAVITTNDQIHQGFHASEDKQTLILRDPGKDELIRIPIPDIRARKTVGSVMPEGLTNGLTRTELRDLVRFVSDLGKPGAYRVPDKAYVRRWWIAADKDVASALWLPRFSRVAGDVPLEDLGKARWLRFNVEVIKPGRFQLQFNNATGLRVSLDGEPTASPELELSKGLHVFTLSLDPSEREGAGIRAQLDPAPGSSGELRILN